MTDTPMLPKGEYGVSPIVTQPCFAHKSVQVTCYACGATVGTTVTRENGAFNLLACLLMCMNPACLLCSCAPLCLGKCKDVRHTCPNCKAVLGVMKPV